MGVAAPHGKRLVSLAQGDPTVYAHLQPCDAAVRAVVSAVAGGTANGYQPSQGAAAARAALANEYSVAGRQALRAQDVFVTLGCSEALSHAVSVLAHRGANMLLPRPGFPLYQILCEYHDVEVRYYDLLPERGWEVDVDQLRRLADDNTAALFLNNPSNPCGAVYGGEHLRRVMGAAEELRLPVIADEVYAHMIFEGSEFVHAAAVTPSVPVLAVSALSKRWLAPGWRLGWLCVHDTLDGVLAQAGVHDTLLKITQVTLGPSAPMQHAVPAILQATPATWYSGVIKDLEAGARVCMERCARCPGLSVVAQPQGAMYLLLRVDEGAFTGVADSTAFCAALLQEEAVAVLPGAVFGLSGFCRIVFAAPVPVLHEAWDRIEAFCKRRAA